MKKLLLATVGLIAITAVGVVVAFFIDQPQFFSEPHFDELPPTVQLQPNEPAILVFSQTNGFRHHEGIKDAQALLEKLARENGWQVFTTENGAIHNHEDLARFRVVVWANASGPLLLPEQRQALQSFIEDGGGFIGIHAAGDGSHKDWPWYQGTILGTTFIGHTLIPHKQEATVRQVSDHSVLAGLPPRWQHYDEWYAFDETPATNGATVLLTVDETSYKPGKFSMTPEHPIVWINHINQGRALYCALGHSAKSFETPEYQRMLAQAITWAGRLDSNER